MYKKLAVFVLFVFVFSIFGLEIYADANALSKYDIIWVDEKYDKMDPFKGGYAVAYKGYNLDELGTSSYSKRVYIDKNGAMVDKKMYQILDSTLYEKYATNCVDAHNSSYRNDVIVVNCSCVTRPFVYNGPIEKANLYKYNCGSYVVNIKNYMATIYDNKGNKIVPKEAIGYFVTYDDLIMVQHAGGVDDEVPKIYNTYTCYNKKGDIIMEGIESQARTDVLSGDTKYLPFSERPSVWKSLGNGKYEPYSDDTYTNSSNTSYKLILPFNDGLTSQKNNANGKYGVLDRKAKLVVPYVLDEPAFFNDGLAVIKYHGKYGIMKDPRTADEKGELNSFAMAKELHDLGLFQGVSKDYFSPELGKQVSSYDAITLIGRALNWDVDKNAKSSFTDVPSWAVPYTEYARENGISSGVLENKFGRIIDGRRMFTWFLAALGEDKDDVWKNTAKYSKKYGIAVPSTSVRNDVVHIIYEGIKHPVVGSDKPLIDELKNNPSKKSELKSYNTLPGLPKNFLFYTVTGGWKTEIAVADDLTFSGEHSDYNISETGNGYPHGTIYKCAFEGKFKNVKKLSDYEYSMELDYITINNDKKSGIYDDIREVWQTKGMPYGFDDAKTFSYYLPGKLKSDLPEDFITWGFDVPDILDTYGIYNIEGKQGFYSIK